MQMPAAIKILKNSPGFKKVVYPLKRLLWSLISGPNRIIKYLENFWSNILFKKGCNDKFFARIYYIMSNPAFGREQQSFLYGKKLYANNLKSPSKSSPQIRRDVHRIEKGLLMKHRRIPFALDYIGDTVDAFVKLNQSSGWDENEKSWARDVLVEYFRLHSNYAALEIIKKKFYDAVESSPACESIIQPQIPRIRNIEKPCPVSIDSLSSLAERRRSVRWFQQKIVDRKLIDDALKIAVQAPSACNRQPFYFRIFDDPQLVRKVVAMPGGMRGYEHNVPVVAVVVGQQRNYFDERDRHLIYIDASLAVMGFILALETLGLASCCINWPDVEINEIRMIEFLKLEPDERPIMLIAIGYPDPDGLVAASAKKTLSQLRYFNFEAHSNKNI
jgi:nitroreductase